MRVIMSNKAEQNISEIYDYISRDSIRYAIETTENIRSFIHDLEISPYLGRYVPEISNKRYREILYKSYRIVYTLSEEIDLVYIHFVIHGKRNFKSFYKSYIKDIKKYFH